MRNGRLFLVAIVLAALGGLGWLFNHYCHFVKEDRPRGYTGEAATNDFLAAQRLIQRMGHPASSIRGIPSPPPVGDTLILPRRQIPMTQAQADALVEWVEKGGTLLAEGLEAESAEAKETMDPLFRAFGARLVEVAEPKANGGTLECTVDEHSMKIHIGTGLQILDPEDGAKSSAGSEDGLQILHFNRGEGICYLFTDLSLLQNPRMGDLDHAEFLCALALQKGDTTRAGCRVWIVAWEEPLSAWTWLRRNALPILIALAALGAGLLWAAAPRFGPLQDGAQPAGRKFLEHLDASGAYHWRHGEGRPLLQACRAAFSRRLGQVHPAWTHLPPDDLCARLAQHAALPEEQVFRALRYDTAPDPAGFLEAIQTLELLRKML